MTTHCDSQSTIHLVVHQTYNKRVNPIDVRLHFVRDVVESGEVRIEKIVLEENPTYVFTSSFPRSRFKHYLEWINFLFHDK